MGTGGTLSGRRVNILHVDTDISVSEGLADALNETEGSFEIVSETDPQDALANLDTTDFDCVVSEYDLSDMTGIELLNAVREDHESLPFILFTGTGDEKVASRAISAEVTDYIRKQSGQDGIDALATRIQELGDAGQSLSETNTRYDTGQFERFLEVFPDAVFVMDEAGRYLDYITGGDRSLLYDDIDELLGQRYHDVLPEETADRFLDTIQQALDTGEQQQIEYQLDVKRGKRWFEARVGPLNTQTEPRTAFWIARDITERKRREQEYEQIFNNVNDAITVFDPTTGDIVDVNETYYEMVGYDDLDTIRELGIDGLSASDEGYTGERGTELIREASQSGEPKTVEWRGETSDGDRLWLEATLAPAEIGGEDRVLSIQRDITERRELERTYQDIFESVSDGLVIHDPATGDILEVNDRYCELTGYDREELLDGTVRQVMLDDPEYTYEEVLTRIKRAREEGPQLFEFKAEKKDGEIFLADVHLRTIEIRGEERVLASVRDITERKRRKQEYEQIFNNVNDIIAVRDPEKGEIIDVNNSYADLLGYDREEMQGMTISDVGVPEEGYDEQQGMEHLRNVVESDGPVEFEWKVEGADGRAHLMDVRGTAALINGDQRYLAIGRDITERKRRERAINSLRKATERLQSAKTPEQVATVAVETASEVLDLPMAICWFHDEDTDQLTPAAATEEVHDAGLVSGLSADRYEYDVFVDGSVTEYTPREQSGDNPFETGVLLPLADHGLIAAVTHHETRVDETVLDIAKALADHVTTALDRVERDQAVRESERRFRLIADRVDEIIYLADADTQDVLYLSPGHEEIWGRSLDDIYEDSQTFTEAIHPEDIDTFTTARQEMFVDIEAGDPDRSYEFSYRIQRPDGEVRWIETTGYPILGDDDHRNRYVALIKDVTERKYREQRLEVFNRILRHNLRNQLDVIRSHAEVLADQATDEHADQIIAAVDELATLGARARKIDRIMSMGDTLGEVRLAETVRETVEAIKMTRGGVGVTTEAPRSATLTTNEEAMQIAVESALENAIEHAESTVTVRVEERTGGYVVTITDDGPGIPDEELVPIEARSETNLRHSRGLGLWQLRWSVDKLNGELSFETTNGTTVRITIPDQDDGTQPN